METKTKSKKEFNYKPQFGVIIICENEEHQKMIFEKLKNEGHKLKIVRI